MKRLAAAAFMALTCASAHADPGGVIPMPGLCDYPFVGVSGMVQPGVGQAGWYACRGMQEAQGQYWIQGLGYYSSNGNVSGGGLFGIDLAGGGGGGLTGYFCLDDPYHPTVFKPAADPKPPGAWKDVGMVATACVPLSDVPQQIPGRPPMMPAPEQLPTVTNPATTNPDATEPPR
jgi:hypothetical protein